ncbi:chromosome assembly protein [Methanoregula sp.]|uniref:chromosome assembly protein n=1 Tax=Methanoregula sp. TaxID=2052170 RepID=UPI003561F16B
MGIFDFIRGNSVDRLDTRELKEEEMRLQNHIELARKDIQKIEKQKKDLFKQGVGADMIKKKMLAQQLKHLDMQAQLKIKQFMTMHKQFMFVSNLVIVKQYEKELKQNKIWSKITNIEPSKFENALINVNLKGKSFEEVLNNLNNVFEMSLTDSDLEQSTDDTEKQLLDAWSGVETGAIDVEAAQKLISMEKQLENKDTEGS